ncbi:hypothetical protein RHMOL_Rhmol11G0033500 [Rhododendron molle]|uniref:Uncharacterized protein n=1 Tax=Rhododendron molle TaxID=49168 RepID=A0ACC0LND8_RHOML|nr:hypothetical protein RHMOL_Rhmol11G0033500 [Rhododendron molle]
MAPNKVEDTPIDVGHGEGFTRTHTKGFAHGQQVKRKVDRNRVEGFAHNQPINQNVSRGYSYYHYNGRNKFEGKLFKNHDDYQSTKQQPNFRYYDNLPKFRGLEFFEDRLDWILDIEDSFQYAKIPTEQMWRPKQYYAEQIIVEAVREVKIEVEDQDEIDIGACVQEDTEIVSDAVVEEQKNIALEVCAFGLDESPIMELTAALQQHMAVAEIRFPDKGVPTNSIINQSLEIQQLQHKMADSQQELEVEFF